MTDSVFPSLIGLAWNVVRTPTWQTRVQTTVAGKETRQADWSYPRYGWELVYDFLRSAPSFSELQTLIGFINAMQGQFGTFLYTDDDDNAVAGQQIDTGDGVTVTFPLIRSFGGYIEPVSRLNALHNVYLAGVAQPTSAYSVTDDAGTESGSSITFTTAPTAGTVITADFSYYWRCRFSADTTDFTKFLYGLSSVSSLKFESVK
jgi:uncharacterized protein (TIGR02217 family)